MLYRELKLRSAIMDGAQLRTLPQEQIYSTVAGIWNLSSDQGNLGTFVVTNVRLVWFADVNGSFNISLPYMQMAAVRNPFHHLNRKPYFAFVIHPQIRLRDSKYGPALVIQTHFTAGNYVLGFRIDPLDRLRDVYKELSSLYAIYSRTPIFGVFYEAPDATTVIAESAAPLRVDDVEEVDHSDAATGISTKMANYLADEQMFGDGEEVKQPTYCEELGLAIEPIREGYTLNDLWQVVVVPPPPTAATSTQKR